MKITSGFFRVCILWVLFRLSRKAGRGRVKEDKPLPLSLGVGPYFESARGLLGGTWELKAEYFFLRIGSAVGHDVELTRLKDRRENFLHVFPF
jgi:hypothetical protein